MIGILGFFTMHIGICIILNEIWDDFDIVYYILGVMAYLLFKVLF